MDAARRWLPTGGLLVIAALEFLSVVVVMAVGQQSPLPRCLPLSTQEERNLLQLAAKDLCPEFAGVYGLAAGVAPLLVSPAAASTPNYRILQLYVAGLHAKYHKQLSHFHATKRDMVSVLAGLLWNRLSREQLLYHIDMMICSAFLPVCTANHLPSVGTQSVSNSSQPHNDSNHSTGSSADLQLTVLQPCSWICQDFQELVSGMLRASPKQSQLSRIPLFELVSRVIGSCASAEGASSRRAHCLNVTASGGSASVFESLYPVRVSSGGHGDGEPDANTSQGQDIPLRTSPAQAFYPQKILCFNLSSSPLVAKYAYFVSTPVQHRWNIDTQNMLKQFVSIAHTLFNISDDLIPFDASLAPYALQCRSVIFEQKDVDLMASLTLTLSQTSLVLNVFAIASFALQWQRMRQYPMPVLLFTNFCALGSVIAFSLQFYVPGGTLCNPDDDSLLIDQPNSGDNYGWCTVQFALMYFFLMSTCNWWACFAHSWYVSFSRLRMTFKSVPQGMKSKKNTRIMLVYHLLAWTPSFVMMVPAVALKKISAQPLYGICWVNLGVDYYVFVVMPQAVALLTGSVFMALGAKDLYNARKSVKRMWESGKIVKPSGKRHTRAFTNTHRYLVQMPLFIAGSIVIFGIQVGVSIYEAVNSDIAKKKIDARYSCLQFACNPERDCPAPVHLPAVPFQIKIVAYFVFSWLMCTWAVFSRETWHRWAHVLHLTPYIEKLQASSKDKDTLSHHSSMSYATQHTTATNITSVQLHKGGKVAVTHSVGSVTQHNGNATGVTETKGQV